MTIEVAPNRIETTDVTGGFAPDAIEASMDLRDAADVLNFLPDNASGALELRHGYTMLPNSRKTALSGYWILHVNFYSTFADGGQRHHYLVTVLTNGTNAVNNVQIWVYDLDAQTYTRVDTAGVNWTHPLGNHWFANIEGTYYGGSWTNPIYSWHPVDGYNGDPTALSTKTWVASVSGSVDTDTEYPKDFAFKKGTKVTLSGGHSYAALRGIRYKTWESGQHYGKGERVSRKTTISGDTYWHSYECILPHDADSDNRPGDGGGSPGTYWKAVTLKPPHDEDGDTTADWTYIPPAPKSDKGIFHGFRLFAGSTDADNKGRVQYSAPAKPEKNALIADLTWEPTDWAPQDDVEGNGGGWFSVPDGREVVLRAFSSYGDMLIMWTRFSCFVLNGTNEQTWVLRRLGDAGTDYNKTVCQHKGLVYFLGTDGFLYRTDGTGIVPAEGAEKVKDWLREQLRFMSPDAGRHWFPTIKSWKDFIVISLPRDEDSTTYTLFYHPEYQSFWLTDLPILDMAVGTPTSQKTSLYFSTVISGQSGQYPALFQYRDTPDPVYTDGDWQAQTATHPANPIPFRYRTSWFQFGSTRNERRIRHVWALMTGTSNVDLTVKGWRNFDGTVPVTQVTRTMQGRQYGEHVEGKTQPDSFAVAVSIEGTNVDDTVQLHGFGVDTQPRRTRFHRGAGS